MTLNEKLPFRQARRDVWRMAKHYAYGCFAKSWNGAIAAVYAFLGLATGASVDPEHFSPPSMRVLWFTFAVAFAINGIGYFKDNPLPEKLADTKPPFPVP